MNLCLAMAMHNEEEELDCFCFAMAMQKAEDSSLADERLTMTMEDLNGKKFDEVAKLGERDWKFLLTWHGLKVLENEWANWENWTMMAYDERLSWQLMTRERQLIDQIACLQRDEMEWQRWINDEAERQLMNAEEVAMGNDGCQQEQEPSLPHARPWKAKFIPRTGDTAGQKLRHYKDKHNEREYRRKLRRAMAKAIAAAESPGDVSREPSEPSTEIGDTLGDLEWNWIGEPWGEDHHGLADRAAVWNLIGM